MQKRGVSDVVATVIIIALVIVAIAVVWLGVMPLIKDKIGSSDVCNSVDVSIESSQGYTCHQANNITVIQIKKGSSGVNVSGLKFLLSSNGNSISYVKDVALGINSFNTFYLNSSKISKLDKIEVVPVVKSGVTNKNCNPVFLETVNICGSLGFSASEIAQIINDTTDPASTDGNGIYGSETRIRNITISNPSGSVLTNFQVGFNITYDSDMKSNFGDLRFFNSGVLIPYWIESSVSGSYAYVWVKVSSIPINGVNITLAYGDSSLTDISSGPNVFMFFDDFSAMNVTKWNSLFRYPSIANGIANFTYNGTDVGIFTVDNSANDGSEYVAEWRYQHPTRGIYARNRLHLNGTGDPVTFDKGDFGLSFYWNGFTGVSLPPNTWVRWIVTVNNTGYYMDIKNDDKTSSIITRSHTSSSSYQTKNRNFGVFATESTDSKFLLDWIYTRKYASVPPIVNINEEISIGL